MIQKKDDKKKAYEPFKLRVTMLDLDKYLRIFIIPQVPAEYKEFREELRHTMDAAWRMMYYAALTKGRERQRRLMDLKIELMMVEVYLVEIREICFRGKLKKKLNGISARRFEIAAKKQRAVMEIIWAWVKNEEKSAASARTQKTAGLVETEES